MAQLLSEMLRNYAPQPPRALRLQRFKRRRR